MSRNAEVMRARVDDLIAGLPPDLVADGAAARLTGLIEVSASGGAGSVDEALSSQRYLDLLDELIDAATHPRTNDLANRPGHDVFPDVFRKSWRRLAKRAAKASSAKTSAETYHRVRIAAKRTRYLAEALVPVYGRPAKQLARRVEEVQDLLGDHQDAVVTGELLRRAAGEPRVGRAAFTFGLLYADEQTAARQAASKFRTKWPQVSRPRHRNWLSN
jgi:CHAD domain-containing protein